MKKSVIILFVILIISVIICVVGININSNKKKTIKQQNLSYEQYFEHVIYGADVITLINKATSSNEKSYIEKDEKGFYINDDKSSIQIDIVMITNSEKQELTTYKMETISKVGITEFIKNFNTVKFKCTKKEYHLKTGKIAYIEITQQGE